MLEWLMNHVPVEFFFAAGLAVVFVVYRYFGLRAAIGAAIAALLFVVRISGQQKGREDREKEGKEDAYKLNVEATKTRNDSIRDSVLHPDKLRDNDGYRRD